MATKKKTEEMENLEAVEAAEAEEIQAEEEPKVTLTLKELRELIAQEVQAQKEETAAAGAVKSHEVKHVAAKPAKKVKVKLFKDNGMYKDPVFVAVNGHRFIVPRGVEVEVPEYIADVLEESFKRDQATAEQLMTMERKFREDSKKLD